MPGRSAEAWERLGRPSPFTLIEYGAGAGTLALAILAGLRDDGSPLADALAYAPVELNRHRLAELRARAAAVGLPVVDAAGLDDAPAAGAVLANEFLDALPVHLVEVREGRPREVHVGIGCDGAFEDVLGELSDAAVATRLEALDAVGIALAEGQRLEVRPAVEAWAREVGRRLAAGLVLVLDYGAPAADLYGPRRRAGTLMTYRGHVAEGDPGAPYRDIGERDITAHVDTTALGAALAGAGFDLLGETTPGGAARRLRARGAGPAAPGGARHGVRGAGAAQRGDAAARSAPPRRVPGRAGRARDRHGAAPAGAVLSVAGAAAPVAACGDRPRRSRHVPS